MSPAGLVLSRLPDARPTGRDRWRCACPVCGISNKSTLSIGIGDTGNVLLKCFKSGCGPDQIAASLGLSVADLFADRGEPGSGSGPPRKRRLLSAVQALDLLAAESYFVAVCAENLAHGIALADADRARLATAAKRIDALRQEANS